MSEQVHQMFTQIAPRYDATNDVLSMGIHRLWRRETVKRSLVQPGDSVLDCAPGTGDLALAFKRAVGPTGEVLGTDFNAGMLSFAPKKAADAGLDVKFEVADAMKLPYADKRFTVASISFGIRNVDDPAVCVGELARVVKPGGRVVVLEFGQPGGRSVCSSASTRRTSCRCSARCSPAAAPRTNTCRARWLLSPRATDSRR